MNYNTAIKTYRAAKLVSGSALLATALFLVATPIPTFAQEVADTIKVRTRVVFIDTLVRDKKTGAPVMDLPVESFQVLDDGKPRRLSYFNREGLGRRPLAIVL